EFSPNAPRFIKGSLRPADGKPVPIFGDYFTFNGVSVTYGQAPAQDGGTAAGEGARARWDLGADVAIFGREQRLAYPFSMPAPQPPLLELRYFGLGQRIQPELPVPATIASVVKAMKDDLAQAEGDAIVEKVATYYRPDAGWLVGMDLTVRDLIDLRFV